MNLRTLVSGIIDRARLANVAGHTFGHKRDLYKALGYQRELFPPDYRSRFKRNAVANRLVKALPQATWRNGAELVEDDDPETETPFEAAFEDLDHRLKIWDTFRRTDILAGIGRYAIILIGAPGYMNTPLTSCTADNIAYLRPYAEQDAKIFKFDIDPKSPRFGLPEFYNITRTTMLSPDSTNSNVVGKIVHYTRIVHISDGLLDDEVYGEPRLECVWNLLDDLEKVSGSGPEAFWRRADGGNQFDLDPTIDFDDDADPNSSVPTNAAKNTGVKKQLEEMEHGLRKNLLTRGVTMTRMGSDVADFKSPIEALVSLISAGAGIPQRVLLGSEQGKLAAKQDRASWDNRVTDRQTDWAGPCVVRPFVERLIKLGALPKPGPNDYDVKWSSLSVMDDEQRATMATAWAGLNRAAGETVVIMDEIREQCLGLPPLQDVQSPEDAALDQKKKENKVNPPPKQVMVGPDGKPVKMVPTKVKAATKGGAGRAYAHVHAAADRFRTARPTHRERLIRRGQARAAQELAASSAREPERTPSPQLVGYGADRIREELEG